MINKHIIQEQAKEFTNRGDAFIHSEMKNGINTLKKEHTKAIDNKIDELRQLKKEMRAMIHTLEELQKEAEQR